MTVKMMEAILKSHTANSNNMEACVDFDVASTGTQYYSIYERFSKVTGKIVSSC
jgi:hypothetical protein